jgi:hypothetical protein
MPPELVRKNTDLFASQVLPHIRHLWSDYEDRWWIHPLPEHQRMAPQAPLPAGVPAAGGE